MSEKFRDLLRKYPGFFAIRFTFEVSTSYEQFTLSYAQVVVNVRECAYVTLKSVLEGGVEEITVKLDVEELPEFITDCVNYREGIK